MHYKQFTYIPETKTFVADISDLKMYYVSQLFELIGKRNTVKFAMDKVTKDREGDIMSWDFKGFHEGVQYVIRIFND